MIQLWNNITKPQKATKAEAPYKQASVYPFSKEIIVNYSVYESDGSYYAKARFAETKDPRFPLKRGKSLTKRSTAGLWADSADEVVNKLEDFVYNESVFRVIVEDITEKFLRQGLPVTAKTLWFCLREDLQK